MGDKIPESILAVIHTPELEVLLLERKDVPGFWQSITGSKAYPNEEWHQTAEREIFEEVGLQSIGLLDWGLCYRYEIYLHWRWRYPEGVTCNTERVFSLCVPKSTELKLSPSEHNGYLWLPWEDAAPRCFSESNREVIRLLPQKHVSTI